MPGYREMINDDFDFDFELFQLNSNEEYLQDILITDTSSLDLPLSLAQPVLSCADDTSDLPDLFAVEPVESSELPEVSPLPPLLDKTNNLPEHDAPDLLAPNAPFLDVPPGERSASPILFTSETPFMDAPPGEVVIDNPEILSSDSFGKNVRKRAYRSTDSFFTAHAASTKNQRTAKGKQTTLSFERLTQAKYQQYYKPLFELGYKQETILQLLSKPSYKLTIGKLIKVHNELIEQLNEENLGHEDLVKVALHSGGFNNLDAFKNNYNHLKELGYSGKQIVSVASHDGGSLNLEYLISYHEKLVIIKKFSFNEMTSIASRNGGSHNIEALSEKYDDLNNNFTKEQIIRMVSRDGGSKNLYIVLKHYEKLCNLGFCPRLIVNAISHHGGSKNIKALIKYYDRLHTLRFTNQQMSSIAGHCGGRLNIKAVVKYGVHLNIRGFKNEDIVLMASNNCGHMNLQIVMDNFKRFRFHGLSPDEITRKSSRYYGAKQLLDSLPRNSDFDKTPSYLMRFLIERLPPELKPSEPEMSLTMAQVSDPLPKRGLRTLFFQRPIITPPEFDETIQPYFNPE
ncbi:hypothetical protein [Legionella worsleiensis]|nr:hypothetical protein [Legionella worsleiensis]